MTCLPNFMKIYQLAQKLLRGAFTQTGRQTESKAVLVSMEALGREVDLGTRWGEWSMSCPDSALLPGKGLLAPVG